MHSPLRFLPSVILKRRPLHLTFFVTRRCNARCPFCFYLGLPDDGGSGELTLKEIERFAPSLGTLLWVAFSGGEIFLRDDLPDICRVIYRANRPSIMLLPTNGLMPDAIARAVGDILMECGKSIVVVKLSIDGLGAEHDALRGREGSFSRVLETYEALRGYLREHRNFELGVNTVFCSANQDRMAEIIGFVRGLEDIKTHTISLARGEMSDASLGEVDMDKYLAAIGMLEAGLRDGSSAVYRFRGARLKAAQDILQRRIIYRTVAEGRRQMACHAGRLNVVMTETGGLYPCEWFTEGMRIGNVRDADYDVGALLRSGRAAKILREIRAGCFCTHECYAMTNILFSPSMYPALFREYIRLK